MPDDQMGGSALALFQTGAIPHVGVTQVSKGRGPSTGSGQALGHPAVFRTRFFGSVMNSCSKLNPRNRIPRDAHHRRHSRVVL